MSKKNKEGKNKDENIDDILDDVDEDAVNDLIKSVQKEVKEEAENQKNNPEVKKKKKKKKVEEEEENEEDEKEEFRKWKEQRKLEKLKKEKMESQKKKKKKKKKDSSDEDDDDDDGDSDSYEDEKPKKKKKKKKKKYDSDEEDEEDSESDEEEYRAREPDISGKKYKKLKQEDMQVVLNYMKKNNLKYKEGINLYNEGNYEDSLDYLTHAKKSFGDLNKLIQEDKNSYPKDFRSDFALKISEKIKAIDESIKKCSKKMKEKASKKSANKNNNNYNYSFNPKNNMNNNANNNMNYNNNQNKQQNLHDKEEDEMDKKVESEIMIKNPNVKFSDIIGMNDMKQTLYEIIIVPQIRPDFFTGIRKPQRGILLFGPPGTGKTMIAKAIASECKSTFFNISASSLTSKWVGESEKTVKSLFKIAYKKVPSIIFIDEIDSILSKRSENENEATKRLKTEFLIQFDGLGSNTNAKLLVIAATNRPMDLDEALLRRLPKRVYCGPLDEDGRFEFIKKVINRVETNLSDDDIREIAKKTNDYSNSDLMELCREAAYQPVRELTTDEILKIKKFRPLIKQDLLTAVQKIRGTLSKKVRDELQKWNDQFGGI